MTNKIIQVLDENGNEFQLANGGKAHQFAFGNFQIYRPAKENFDLSELVFVGEQNGKTVIHAGMDAFAWMIIWQDQKPLDAIILKNKEAIRPDYGTGKYISEDIKFHMPATYQHSLVHALNIPHHCKGPNTTICAGEAAQVVAALKGAGK